MHCIIHSCAILLSWHCWLIIFQMTSYYACYHCHCHYLLHCALSVLLAALLLCPACCTSSNTACCTSSTACCTSSTACYHHHHQLICQFKWCFIMLLPLLSLLARYLLLPIQQLPLLLLLLSSWHCHVACCFWLFLFCLLFVMAVTLLGAVATKVDTSGLYCHWTIFPLYFPCYHLWMCITQHYTMPTGGCLCLAAACCCHYQSTSSLLIWHTLLLQLLSLFDAVLPTW